MCVCVCVCACARVGGVSKHKYVQQEKRKYLRCRPFNRVDYVHCVLCKLPTGADVVSYLLCLLVMDVLTMLCVHVSMFTHCADQRQGFWW